jgi:Mrp family chromosome partitioning ATPase
LCACLADAGDATLLVEVDLRRPSMKKVFGCTIDPPGVEDALKGKVTPECATHFVDELGFYASMVAVVPRNPSHLLGGTGCKDLLAWARQRFRWIVFDTAPVMPNADVAELLPAVDAALLVVRAQRTPKELSRRAFDVLGKRLYGVVLNEATLSSAPYYRYLSDYCHPALRAS